MTAGLLAMPLAARAGTYTVTYSGGSYTTTPGSTSSFTSNGTSYGGGNGWNCYTSSPNNPTSFTVSASGPITATFTWNNGGNANDLPPATAIVEQYCSAQWSGYGTNGGTVSGGCNIVFSGTSVPAASPNSGVTVSGYLYTVQDNPGTSFSVTYNPSAYIVGSGSNTPGSSASGGAGITYIAAASPATISFTGTALDRHNADNILIGQGCQAALNTPGYTQTAWAWQVSGTTFQSWSNAPPPPANNPNASYYVSGSGTLTSATAHWFWNDPLTSPATANESVTCTATVAPPTGQGNPFSVTTTKSVIVQVPAWTATGTGGYMQINTNAPSQNGSISLYAGPTFGESGGMNWEATSTTPSTPAFGTGTLELVQIVTPELSYTDSTTRYDEPENGLTGLDTRYPYNASAYTEGGYPYHTFDSPSISLNNGIVWATMQHQFTDYLMYQPPGTDHQWVPLATFTWSTNGNATIPPSGNWADYRATHGTDSAGTVTPAGNPTSFTASNTFPSWTRINVFPGF